MRTAVQPLARPRVRLDRRHAFHDPGRRPRGPLVRHGAHRVRSPRGGSVSGFVVWFTGLSAAGKSTIAGLVAAELEQRGLVVDTLDGDVVRTHLSKGLGFSKEDRDTNIERIGWVASRLARAGAAVAVSAIAPYDEARRQSPRLVW